MRQFFNESYDLVLLSIFRFRHFNFLFLKRYHCFMLVLEHRLLNLVEIESIEDVYDSELLQDLNAVKFFIHLVLSFHIEPF
mmetsp:Transcript_7868/g.7352  ORF Transcript_7868/g.7352 Transcript_7868/m.7352 type:complete len:81 (-) Transcript_7868:338-580(-)